jgi:P27 family predicted phage terminase small subunit
LKVAPHPDRIAPSNSISFPRYFWGRENPELGVPQPVLFERNQQLNRNKHWGNYADMHSSLRDRVSRAHYPAMGRAKKPSAIKVLEGNRAKVGKDRIRADLKAKGKPSPPPGLSAVGVAMWKDVLASLPPNLLTRADNAILERFVRAWERYRICQDTLDSTSLTTRHAGALVRNPLVNIQMQAAAEMHKAGAELGLSPVARARLAESGDPQGDDMDYLLGMSDDEREWTKPN